MLEYQLATWYSPDLKLVLQSTQTDPHFGETTYSLTNVQRSEPDSTLFQVPAGYTVEKVPVTVQIPVILVPRALLSDGRSTNSHQV